MPGIRFGGLNDEILSSRITTPLYLGSFLYHYFGGTDGYLGFNDLIVTTPQASRHPTYLYCTYHKTVKCTVHCYIHSTKHCTVE